MYKTKKMDIRYTRNRIYISPEEQNQIKDFSILIGGCGIGSVIAECALRLGFENFTIVDGDRVEESNLNRQNYLYSDIGLYKTEALSKRLKAINPDVKINSINSYISEGNLESIIGSHNVAINALDFSSEIPLLFDSLCQSKGIPVLHPYNIGWGALLTVISPMGSSLELLKKPNEKFNEVNMVKYASQYSSFWKNPQLWIEDILEKYQKEEKKISPPQLSIASWLVASMSATILFKIATEKKVKTFPEFYLSHI